MQEHANAQTVVFMGLISETVIQEIRWWWL